MMPEVGDTADDACLLFPILSWRLNRARLVRKCVIHLSEFTALWIHRSGNSVTATVDNIKSAYSC